MPRFLCLLAAVSAFAWPSSAATDGAQRVEHDDCQADFIAFVGADAYQFSPLHTGELGSVRLFSVLSFQRAAARGESGRVYWRLRVSAAAGGRAVWHAWGSARLEAPAGQALVEQYWHGRGDDEQALPAGRYTYTFEARFLPDALAGRSAARYEDLAGVVEAQASSDDVILDPGLSVERALALRASARATTCEIQQNEPLEAGFGYNFYYGSTHAHTTYSDGGQPTNNCSSGNAYGSGTATPADAYAYARFTSGLDFWVINEHNHLINDSVAANNAPVTEAKVRQRYQDGRNAAAAATVDGSFVALYGMEWGVSTNTDQGHVTLIDTPVLFGWETCTTCNGPNAECTPGSNCYFDVFTPKRFGYLTLYRRSVENPSPAGALGILCHPGSGNFDNFARNADADAALQGIAVRSGLAFSNATNCADANVASTDYSSHWRNALNLGFRLGPTADHDSHCINYGQALPTRTVYLLPNTAAPALTKSGLLQAHKARRFFASEDPNAQLVFAAGTRVMGEAFSAAGGTPLRAAVYDPAGESVSTFELWRGQVGAGAPSAPYRTFSNQASFSVAETLTSGTYYYFVRAVQADGHDLWSAPMWITWTPGSDTQPPTTSITAPASGATVSGTVSVTAAAADDVGVTAVEFYLDGTLRATDTTAPYSWSWDTLTSVNGSHTLTSRASDAAGNTGTSTAVSVSVNNTAGVNISGWRLVQANSAITYTLPAGTTVPAGGYVIVARNATKAAFEAFWRGGAALPSNVVYINSAGAIPQINGSETYTLNNAAGTRMDGPTVAMASSANQALRRKDPCNTPNASASWNIGATTTADPGAGAGAGCAKGVVINEFADAAGTGNFIYEFVELHHDN
jgi:hypothetical protein